MTKSENSIPLHPDHGVNPKLLICPQCGKETGEIALAGKSNAYRCVCGAKVVGYEGNGKPVPCPICGNKDKDQFEFIGPLGDSEKLVSASLCKDCAEQAEKEKKAMQDAVAAGGVYFRCKCGAAGVINAGTELAKKVREHTKIAAPDPVGLDMNACPMCTKKGVADDEHATGMGVDAGTESDDTPTVSSSDAPAGGAVGDSETDAPV